MSVTTSAAVPIRLRMNIIHGGRGAIIAAGTAAAADHSILAAVIVAAAGLGGVVLGPIVTGWVRNRHKPSVVDHAIEYRDEQAELAMLQTIDHLIDQVSERDAEIARLRDRLSRRRRS